MVSYQDEINGSETFRMQGNRIGPDRNTDIYLDAQCVVSKDGKESWSLLVLYESCLRSNKDVLDLIDVESGETLILQIDGTRIGLKRNGSNGHRKETGACVPESVVYDVILAELRQIVNGEKVTAKLIGSRDSIKSEFTQSNFENLKTFLHQHSQHKH